MNTTLKPQSANRKTRIITIFLGMFFILAGGGDCFYSFWRCVRCGTYGTVSANDTCVRTGVDDSAYNLRSGKYGGCCSSTVHYQQYHSIRRRRANDSKYGFSGLGAQQGQEIIMDDRDITEFLAGGSNSAFWETLKLKLLNLKKDAISELIMTPPEWMAKVCEYQMMVRTVDQIIATVETARLEIQQEV